MRTPIIRSLLIRSRIGVLLLLFGLVLFDKGERPFV